jgi:hypothetical protein
MIINDFNFEGIPTSPYEAYAILVVDPDAVLADSVSLQRFQSIAWENGNIRQHNSSMDLH